MSRAVAVAAALLVFGCGGAAPRTREPMPDPLDTVTAEQLFDRAVDLARGQDYVRAEQYLLAALERGIPEARIVPLLVSVCVRSSRLSAALRYAEPYLERNPEDWSLRLLVATIQMGLGETAAARTHLERLVLAQPEQPVPHYMLAVLARDTMRDPETAERHFRRYLELAPDGEHAVEARAALAQPVAARSAAAAAVAPHADVPAEPGSAGATGGPVRLPSQESVPDAEERDHLREGSR